MGAIPYQPYRRAIAGQGGLYEDGIRELREDHDLSQAKIAEVLGASQQMYSRYETGEHETPVMRLVTLVKFYRVSADYILGLSNRKEGIYEIENRL